ncbi:hypothetical protein BGY98DRAFT_937550 [Russula aff. rugulosa BPL654]|nr:hypothetical protein BGY98DRAFT_937550 [Russula aff. rugulosa BPL654]
MTSVYGLGATIIKLHQYMIFSPALSHLNVTGVLDSAFDEEMRRYNIVSGILFIIFIIDFALAAPVLVQEKSRACDDVVQVTKDVITVLGKRVEEELEKLAEGYLKTLGNPVDSSWAHASAESAPSAPDAGRTSVVQAQQASSSASSTTNPDYALVGPSRPSPAVPQVHEVEGDSENAGSDGLHGPPPSPASSEVGLNEGLTEALNPNPGPSTNSDFDWDHWMKETSVVETFGPKAVDRLGLRLELLDEGGEFTIAETSVVDRLEIQLEKYSQKIGKFKGYTTVGTRVVPTLEPKAVNRLGNQLEKKVQKIGKFEGSATAETNVVANFKPKAVDRLGNQLEKIDKIQKFKKFEGCTSSTIAGSSVVVLVVVATLEPKAVDKVGTVEFDVDTSPATTIAEISPPNTEPPKDPGAEPVEVEVIHEPLSSPDSEPHSDHQSLSPASPGPQQEDPEAALYRAKGKAKVIEKPNVGDDSDSD